MNTVAFAGSIIDGRAKFAGVVDPNLVIGSVIRHGDGARDCLKHNADPTIRGVVDGADSVRDVLLRLFQNAAVCAKCGAHWDSVKNKCMKCEGIKNEKSNPVRENREPACGH